MYLLLSIFRTKVFFVVFLWSSYRSSRFFFKWNLSYQRVFFYLVVIVPEDFILRRCYHTRCVFMELSYHRGFFRVVNRPDVIYFTE